MKYPQVYVKYHSYFVESINQEDAQLNMQIANTNVFLAVIIAVILLFTFSKCTFTCGSSIKSNYANLDGITPPEYSTDLTTVGHRPSTGDYLPTVGDTATGDDDHVMESDSYSAPLSDVLCEECVSHCVDWATRHGLSTDLTHDRVKCRKYCKIECDPTTGF